MSKEVVSQVLKGLVGEATVEREARMAAQATLAVSPPSPTALQTQAAWRQVVSQALSGCAGAGATWQVVREEREGADEEDEERHYARGAGKHRSAAALTSARSEDVRARGQSKLRRLPCCPLLLAPGARLAHSAASEEEVEEEDGGDVAIADELLARAEQDLVNAGGTVPTQVPLPTFLSRRADVPLLPKLAYRDS